MTKTILLSVTLALSSPALAHLSPPLAGGEITRQEAVVRADRLFDALDANHDGILTRGEAMREGKLLRAERASTGVDVAPGIGGHTERFFERRFVGERTITRRAFYQAMVDHFDRMDRNHDGVLTPDEGAEGN